MMRLDDEAQDEKRWHEMGKGKMRCVRTAWGKTQ